MEHQLKIASLINFRDIGGFVTESGKTMKTGLLFRSEDLSRLTPPDFAQLEAGLRSIIDLRTPAERDSRSNRIPENTQVKIVHLPIYYQDEDLDRWKMFRLLRGKSGGAELEHFIENYYRSIAFENTTQIQQLFTLLGDSSHLPALFHCSAGKDRTGVVAALIQLMVGVPRSTVLSEYLLTNDLSAVRMKKYARLLRWLSLFQITPERIQGILEARPAYLNRILDEIFERYGGIEDYLIRGCGVEEASLRRLKAMLV